VQVLPDIILTNSEFFHTVYLCVPYGSAVSSEYVHTQT